MSRNLKHGKGLFRLANGSVVYGDWIQGKMMNLNINNLSG